MQNRGYIPYASPWKATTALEASAKRTFATDDAPKTFSVLSSKEPRDNDHITPAREPNRLRVHRDLDIAWCVESRLRSHEGRAAGKVFRR